MYTDTLAALVSSLAFLALLRLAQGEGRRRDVVLFVAACAGCGLTRFSLLPVAALFAVALVVVGHLPGRLRPGRAWTAALAAGGAVVVTSGWFYARNLALTGNLSGSHPDWAARHTSRVARPVHEVAVDPVFWSTMTEQMSVGEYPRLPRALEPAGPWTVLLLLLPVLVGLGMALVRILRAPEQRAVRLVLLATVLCTCGGVAAMQVMHHAGGGSAFARYFFAMLPFLAPFMVLPLLQVRGIPLVLWGVARATLLALELEATLGRQLRGAQAAVYPGPTWYAFGLTVVGLTLALVLVVTQARVGRWRDQPSETPPAAVRPLDAT